MTNEQIEQQVYKVADQILEDLGEQSGFDPHLAIAALAVALFSLARADGTSLADIEKVIEIAREQVSNA